jgi:NAD(P)-dependent dehydrogenase (short-subunit alcohol dehydrogenase family)
VPELAGNSAIVTGGAQGIGLGVAQALIEEGASVLLFDLNGERAEEAALQLGEGALAHVGSVSEASDVERAFEAAEAAFGPPRILVNNAGNARASLIADCSEEQWDETIGGHLKGTFLCTRELARRARESAGGGAIVNLSSINHSHASEGTADYSAAKAGISHFTRIAALELAPYGVRVNAVAPGGTNTPMAERHAAMREEFVARTPLGRFGEVDDIAKAVLFLVSDQAAWITGVTLPVDGGAHLRGLHNFHATLTRGEDFSQPMTR